MSTPHHEGGEEQGSKGGGGLGLGKAATEVMPEGQVKRVEHEVGEKLAGTALDGIVGTIQELLEPGKKTGGHGSSHGGGHESH